MTNSVTLPSGQIVLSVSELTSQVKEAIDENFSVVWVSGEITGFRKQHSGHWYFTLKDAGAVLPSVMFKGSNIRARFDPKDGMEVIARGKLDVYPPHGKYQLIVQELIPKGLGAQDLALKQLKEKLLKKGYFAPERKRQLPCFPCRIALITSPTGAAVRDMLEILGRRWPAVEVWVCPVRVQGETAPREIAETLARLNRLRGFDVIILGRGGGSSEDLGAFNDEKVADAIFQSAIPVVSAVGHEIDVTIADLVADQQALTPTHAASMVVPDCEEMLKRITMMRTRMDELLWDRLNTARRSLADLQTRRIMRRPMDRVEELNQRVDDTGDRLQRGMKRRIQRWQQGIESMAGRLEALSPLNVLRRGYSLTRLEVDKAVLRNAVQVKFGDMLVTTLQQGEIISRAEKIVPSK